VLKRFSEFRKRGEYRGTLCAQIFVASEGVAIPDGKVIGMKLPGLHQTTGAS
jgi:hypothetical protein